MTDGEFFLVERKSNSIILNKPGKASEIFVPAVESFGEVVRSIVSDVPVKIHVTTKFKKFGDKEQPAALLNVVPGFAETGLDPDVAHIVLNGERAGLKADAAKLADAAIFAIARFVDLVDGPGVNFDERFSWVPYASLLAVSHPSLKALRTVHPVTRRSVPFADRYLTMALSNMVTAKEMFTGRWNRSRLLEIVLATRQRHETRPLALPTTVDVMRSTALLSLREAEEAPSEVAAAA